MTISAKIIADSVSQPCTRIVTMELEYPRFIHAELMTHRMFSRNAASSRAIPIQIMLDTIHSSPAMPIHWGKNQPGMQASEEVQHVGNAKDLWKQAAVNAAGIANMMNNIGLHKQVANRITEPFQHMKLIVTATEWDNWFKLRTHKDAQPEIQALARAMLKEFNSNVSEFLYDDEWHVPYVKTKRQQGIRRYYDSADREISLADALMISASCCAQVSYRKNNESLEKAAAIFKTLIESDPQHASPVEHQAKPIQPSNLWQVGITHVDRSLEQWSGNFKGWIQYRQYLQQHGHKL